MVTRAIIALRTGIVVTNLTSSRSKARDAKRVSDLGQIQLALELYFDRCKQYPAFVKTSPITDPSYMDINLSTAFDNGCSSGITFQSFLAYIPTPPNSYSNYGYAVNSGSYPTDYLLHVTLENVNEVTRDGYIGASYGDFTCDTPSPSQEYCLSPR